MKLKNVARVAAVPLLTTALVTTAGAGTAHAAPRKFVAEIVITNSGAAVATVSDTIVPSNRYTIALTATGGGFCSITFGDTINLGPSDTISEVATGSGNPATASTPGDSDNCSLEWASMTYTLTWVGVLGTTAQLQVQCSWVNRVRACTPSRVEGDASVLPI